MTIAQFLRAVVQQADERPVDVAEAEEAEVEDLDVGDLVEPDFKVSKFQCFYEKDKAPTPCNSETLQP